MAGKSAAERAMVAVMDKDYDEAREILEDFFPTELRQLADQVSNLADLIDSVARGKSAR